MKNDKIKKNDNNELLIDDKSEGGPKRSSKPFNKLSNSRSKSRSKNDDFCSA